MTVVRHVEELRKSGNHQMLQTTGMMKELL